MYRPSYTQIDDRETIVPFIHAYGFATLISQTADGPTASHLPVLLDESDNGYGTLRSHMARANPQWQQFAPEREVLCIFHQRQSGEWMVH